MSKTLKIIVEKPQEPRLVELGVRSWPIGTKGVSTFDWQYDEKEICLFLEGDVTVQTPSGSVSFGKEDLVTFFKGLSCAWQVKKPVRKHYRFGEA